MLTSKHLLGTTAVVLLACLPLLSCRGMPSSRPPIHPNPNMDYQEKLQPQEASNFFYDGSGTRPPIEGTIARGDLRTDLTFYSGRDAEGQYLTSSPLGVDDAVLARGAERYLIYCQPCHDNRGTGRGVLYEYGNVPTASFHDEQRSAYTDGQLFDIITNGSGLMLGYEFPISASDRWAIVAHVRKLQEDRRQAQAAIAGR